MAVQKFGIGAQGRGIPGGGVNRLLQAVQSLERVAFAFDPKREAIVLVAGDKSGGSEKRFYKRLIAKADERLNEHLALLKQQEQKRK